MKQYLRKYDQAEAFLAGQGHAGRDRQQATSEKLQAWSITWDHMAGGKGYGLGNRLPCPIP